MKITLVCPTNRHGGSATSGIYYPMGILVIGSKIKDTYPDYEVQVIDGEVKSLCEIETLIRGSDVLGLSANTMNYPNCLVLSKIAKEKGTKRVVIGGPHPTAAGMAERILVHQPTIDSVIANDGDEAFLQYIQAVSAQGFSKEGSFGSITNLIWRNGKEIKRNACVIPTLPPRFVDMNFDLIDFSKYREEHKKEFPDMSERFVEGFTHVGCSWRVKLGCVFCDIPYPVNSYQPPSRFWREIKVLRDERGIHSVKDYGDCFTGNSERVEALLRARPNDLANIQFSLYGKPNEVTIEMANMLKELNVRYVYLGYDSGDNSMLKSMRKGATVSHNYQATELLAKAGINITGSIILGSEGESEQTINNTERFANEISLYSNVTQLHCAMMTPFPGAPLFEKLKRKYPEIDGDDVLDTEFTKNLWAKGFCGVSAEYIEERARIINQLNKSSRKRYFGFRNSVQLQDDNASK